MRDPTDEFRHYARLVGSTFPAADSTALLPRALASRCQRLETSEEFAALQRSLHASDRTSTWWLTELLRRSRFYHGVLAGEPDEFLWHRIEGRLGKHDCEGYLMLLLDGCRFPAERLEIFDHYEVRRFSREEIRALGPPDDLIDAFFSE